MYVRHTYTCHAGLDQVLDSHNAKHLGKIADFMYDWEGPIAEGLDLTITEVADIKQQQTKLNLQTYAPDIINNNDVCVCACVK